MQFKTTSRKELAASMNIGRTTLYRHMKQLNPDFQKQIKRRVLLPSEVEYIYEQITKSEKWKTGSI